MIKISLIVAGASALGLVLSGFVHGWPHQYVMVVSAAIPAYLGGTPPVVDPFSRPPFTGWPPLCLGGVNNIILDRSS